jgi:hypothetical protein
MALPDADLHRIHLWARERGHLALKRAVPGAGPSDLESWARWC